MYAVFVSAASTTGRGLDCLVVCGSCRLDRQGKRAQTKKRACPFCVAPHEQRKMLASNPTGSDLLCSYSSC
jgi:hypothetical protein